MDENRRLDDELAEITDALLEKRAMTTSDDASELTSVVRGLHELIEPNKRPPAALETRLKQRLDTEWEMRQRRMVRRPSPAVRAASLAAALVVVLVAGIFLMNTPPDSGGMQGTALGSTEAVIALVAVAAVVGVAVLVWRSRR